MAYNISFVHQKAWEVLLECRINRLPVDLTHITAHYNINVVAYSEVIVSQLFKNEILNGDGFTTRIGNSNVIFINDKIPTINQRRCTAAHEIGHILLGHNIGNISYKNNKFDDTTKYQELQANTFARDLLMPSAILVALNLHYPKDIAEICEISYQSAMIKAEELKNIYLNKNNNYSSLDIKLKNQFKDFINQFRTNNK